MEYFTTLIKKMSRNDGFSFHYHCKQLRLTQLIFVDDLMLFSKGNIQLVVLMVKTLKAFEEASGLMASLQKSAIYNGNVMEEIQQRIVEITKIKKGEFPFRYLGVSITSKSLSKGDCNILIDKMLKRINAVLMSIHSYWVQVFVLPKGVIQKIVQMCRVFL